MVCSDWETTLTELEQSLRRDPKDSATCRRLADAYAVRGRLKDTVSTYLHLTDILQSCGDFEHALQVSGLVLKLQPDSEAARLRRIRLFEGRQQPEQCLQAYRELALLYIDRGQGAQAIDLLQRAQRAFPENLDVHLELAETHVAEGHISQAIQLFRQASELFLQSGETERASHALRRMKVLNPNEIGVLLQLGKLYFELDRLGEAEQELRGVLRQCLNHEEALMLLGQVCQRKGQGRDASLAFNRLLSLNPECWEAHHRLAQVMHAQGMTAEAIASYLSAGEGYLSSGQRELAIIPLRQLLALDPAHPTAICHLANLGASLQPQPQALPEPTSPSPAPASTPSGELRRELKRRVLPGEEAKQALLKPMPGTRQTMKITAAKPVLVKAPSVDEAPLFLQSLVAQVDVLPDFEGSNDWLLQEEVDQLPDFTGSFEWLESEALSLLSMDWRQPALGLRPVCPASTGWPGEIWIQRGFGKLSEELDFWAQVVSENPGLWQARAEWAELSLKLGLCDQAIGLYREVVALAEGNDEMRHRLIQALIWNDQNHEAAEACLDLALLYSSRNDRSEAVEVLQLLLQLEPHHLEARRLLACWSSGQAARNHLEKLIEQAARQNNWEVAYAAGQQLLEQEPVSNAARQLLMQAAASLNHTAEAAQQARILLEQYSQTSQWSQACAVCEQLMAWESGHTRLWIKLLETCGDKQKLASARCQLAQELFTQGQSEAAISLLAESYTSDRQSAEHLLDLLAQDQDPRALDLARRLNEEDLASGRTQALEDRCMRLLQSFPEQAELLLWLGRSYQQQGRWEEALQQFQHCRRQPGWLHQSTLALAHCLMQKAGMEDVARRQVERVLQIQGKPEEMEALRQFLAS